MTTERLHGRKWTLRSGYRRAGRMWLGLIYWSPPFVDSFIDDVPSRLIARHHAFTERGIRRRLTRRLRKERRAMEQRDNWSYRGKRARSENPDA